MKVLFSIIIFSIITSCQGQEHKKIEIKKNQKISNMELFTKVLKSQICFGADSDRGMECDLFMKTTSKESFEVSILVIDTVLIRSGYKKIEKTEFNNKLKNIFGSYLFDIYLNQNIMHFDLNINNPKCDTIAFSEDKFLYTEGSEKTGYHIVKDKQIISNFYYLPELVDYQKEYPKIAKLENLAYKYYDSVEEDSIEVTRWKDLKDLPQERRFNHQLLISRNKYLFNDDQSQFSWLINNDEYFMRSLVTTFGYTEDKKLLKWVVENTSYDEKNNDEFGKLLWTKNCNNTISIHTNTFQIINEFSQDKKEKYLSYLLDYLQYILHYENKNSNDLINQISLSQKSELIAHIINFGENYRYTENLGKEDPYKFMGWTYMRDYKKLYKKEFEKNNYYHLPLFKERYNNAKEYWGIEVLPLNEGSE